MSRGALLLALLPITGCDMILGIDDLVADRVGGGTCVDVCGAPGCGECPTVPMVDIPHPTNPYRIDAYEVTNLEYQAFLEGGFALSRQDPRCEYNLTFEPGVVPQETIDAIVGEGIAFSEADIAECQGWLQKELDDFGGNRPVSCVDVCDARAYCAWAGKRLCGRIGGDILDVTQQTGSHADPEMSEWHRACSPSANAFPYGPTYEPGRCTDAAKSPNRIYDVGYSEDCVGGYPGIFDMSGNVGEWDNSCTEFGGHPAGENCLARGGFFYQGGLGADGTDLACGFFRDALQAGPSTSLGLRCCSD